MSVAVHHLHQVHSRRNVGNIDLEVAGLQSAIVALNHYLPEGIHHADGQVVGSFREVNIYIEQVIRRVGEDFYALLKSRFIYAGNKVNSPDERIGTAVIDPFEVISGAGGNFQSFDERRQAAIIFAGSDQFQRVVIATGTGIYE